MKLKRITACLLAGALVLSAALTGCGTGIKADAVGATLNGEEISLGFLNFMAKYQQASFDTILLPTFGTEMWSSDMYGDGKTMEESTKESLVENVETMYLLEDHMKDYKVEITEDELKAMEETAKKFMDDNSKKAIKQVGATEEYVKEMLRLYTIQAKMRDAIFAEVDTEVSDEEAAQRTFSYIKIDKTAESEDENADGAADADASDSEDDSAGSGDEAAEEGDEATGDDGKAAEEQKQKAKKVAKAAKKDFDQAAKDGEYTVEKFSYGSDFDAEEDSMDEAVIKKADQLKEGEVSGVITTDDGFYIIRLDSEFDREATDDKKESIISQRQEDHFTEVCDGYKEEAKFELNEKEWAKVKFDKLFQAVPQEEDAEDTDGENTETTPDEGSEDSEE